MSAEDCTLYLAKAAHGFSRSASAFAAATTVFRARSASISFRRASFLALDLAFDLLRFFFPIVPVVRECERRS